MTTDGRAGTPRRRWRRAFRALLIATLLAIYPARRAVEYAAEPTTPKDCPPAEPEASPPMASDTALPDSAALPWSQRGGTINDASCLNRTPIRGIVEVRQIDDVRKALAFARQHKLRVSIAGVRHSMGGQAFARHGVVLDMRNFNRIVLDGQRATVRVESGASWHDIQKAIHPKWAVKSMQSTDIFTVGGSISVNAHGMDHRSGSVGRSVRSMRVMLADGTVRNVSRTEDVRLFNLVVGGYGLFGVILEVDLDVVPNAVYQSTREILDYQQLVPALASRIVPDPRVGLMYAHLSTAPQSLLRETIVYTYREVPGGDPVVPPLTEVGQIKLRRLVFNLSKHGSLAMRLKWFAEKRLEPLLESCTVSRNQALGEGEACLVSRNDPMHDSVAYLRNNLARETDILHEYFIPRARFVQFVDGLREIVRSAPVPLLNASVRVVHREDNVLTYAPVDDMLAVVLYVNQSTDRTGREQMDAFTKQLIDLCLRANGRFFLPYQVAYTREQLEQSYPQIREFLAARTEFDPERVLSNTFVEKLEALLGLP
jgi:FAD/FMN-containing dehydrogenase